MGREYPKRGPEDVSYQELQTQHLRVHRFLPTLLCAIPFGVSPAGETVREVLQYLNMREETGPRGWFELPSAVVNNAWHHYMVPNGTVAIPRPTPFASSIGCTTPCGDEISSWPQACAVPIHVSGC